MLNLLRQEYILSHDGISPRLAAGLESPPREWLNKRLIEMGYSWQAPETAQTTRAVEATGSIQLVLHLERRADNNDIPFHLTATNIGSATVVVTRVYLITAFMKVFEIEKNQKRSLPPHGQIDYPGRVFSQFAIGKRFSAIVQYERPDLTDSNEFSSNFEFAIDDTTDSKRSINPYEWHTQSGSIEQTAGPPPHAATAFAQPAGTIVLKLQEAYPDGSPNIMTLNGNSRSFRFDPVARTVEFTVSYDQKPVSISTEIPALPPGGRSHRVAFGWDDADQGINMSIDGLPAVSSPGYGHSRPRKE